MAMQSATQVPPTLSETDTEATPLLPSQKPKPSNTTPLPKLQLTLTYLIRVVEPLSNNVVYPFINQMLVDLGAANSPETVGYANGVVSRGFVEVMKGLSRKRVEEEERRVEMFWRHLGWGR